MLNLTFFNFSHHNKIPEFTTILLKVKLIKKPFNYARRMKKLKITSVDVKIVKAAEVKIINDLIKRDFLC